MSQIEAVVNMLFALSFIFLLLTHRQSTAAAVKKALDEAQAVTKAIEPLVEATPLKPYVNVLEMIEQAAQKGVQFAQQMFNEDPTVDRPQIAVDFTHNALSELGVDLSDRVQKLVDGAIKASVYELRKGDPSASQPVQVVEKEVPAPIPPEVQQLVDAAKALATSQNAPAAPAVAQTGDQTVSA